MVCVSSLRSESGFNVANMNPPPPGRLPPVKPTTVAIAGSERIMSTSCCSLPSIAWNEMLWSARMPPLSWPRS